MIFTNDNMANNKAFTRIAYFLSLITPLKKEAVTWYYKQIQSLPNIIKTPTVPYTSSTVINADKYIFDYLPKEKGISVTVID